MEHYEAAARLIDSTLEQMPPLSAEREVRSGKRTTVLSRLVDLYRKMGQRKKAAEVLHRL